MADIYGIILSPSAVAYATSISSIRDFDDSTFISILEAPIVHLFQMRDDTGSVCNQRTPSMVLCNLSNLLYFPEKIRGRDTPKMYSLMSLAAARAWLALSVSSVSHERKTGAEQSSMFIDILLDVLPSNVFPERYLSCLTVQMAATVLSSCAKHMGHVTSNPCDVNPRLADLADAIKYYVDVTCTAVYPHILGCAADNAFKSAIYELRCELHKSAAAYASCNFTISQLRVLTNNERWIDFLR